MMFNESDFVDQKRAFRIMQNTKIVVAAVMCDKRSKGKIMSAEKKAIPKRIWEYEKIASSDKEIVDDLDSMEKFFSKQLTKD